MAELIKHYRQLVGIAKSWAMKNMPGWSDESHRDMLTLHGASPVGRTSALSMNVPQLAAVLEDYERRGWPRHKRVFNPSTGSGRTGQSRKVPPRIAYLFRLWSKLGTAGKIERTTRPALLAFCVRQVGHPVPDLDSLSVAECQKIIEAMKGWLNR